MPISNYPNGFANGIVLQNIPLFTMQNNLKKVWWVDSNTGSNGNKGVFSQPFATLKYAVSRADEGEIIIVAAGHLEEVLTSSEIDFNINGLTVYFTGEGENRGIIDFGGVVGSSIDITGNNITLVNPHFKGSVDALTGPINVSGPQCKIINAEYYDGDFNDTTDCLIVSSGANNLKVYGWKYIVGAEAGTQKQSHIQIDGAVNVELRDIDILGDFATGNIENVTTEMLNVRLENVKLNNLNTTPTVGMVLDADSTGWAKNVDIRVASGTTYVSSVAKLNWDKQCLGYNTDGKGGTDIATFA